jgi:hypothetical protein
MDILNFISWIRGRRQVTSVDPTKTLIPVGLKDGRRDDEYLAGAISVEDFAAQIAPPPTPSVNIYNSNGSLTGNRTLTGNNNILTFTQLTSFAVQTSAYNTAQLLINDNNFYTVHNTNQIGLKLDFTNRVYQLGQINGSNTTTLKIDDVDAYPVQVNGTNVTANTAGVSSGQFLKIKVNGVDYKIALLNP